MYEASYGHMAVGLDLNRPLLCRMVFIGATKYAVNHIFLTQYFYNVFGSDKYLSVDMKMTPNWIIGGFFHDLIHTKNVSMESFQSSCILSLPYFISLACPQIIIVSTKLNKIS